MEIATREELGGAQIQPPKPWPMPQLLGRQLVLCSLPFPNTCSASGAISTKETSPCSTNKQAPESCHTLWQEPRAWAGTCPLPICTYKSYWVLTAQPSHCWLHSTSPNPTKFMLPLCVAYSFL